MKQVLKVYDVRLTAEGPVYIGSGRSVGKKEYVYLPREKKIVVLEPSKLSRLLSKKGLVLEYGKFQLGSSRNDIGEWLRKNRVSEKEYLGCAKYSLDFGDVQMDRSKLEIQEFIKDAYGMPYVPGSSIKGMIRTVLLAYDIGKNPEKYEMVKRQIVRKKGEKTGRTNFLKGEADGLEEIGYRTLQRPETRRGDAVNDCLSGMVVGDSEPLSTEDLILCQRTELHVDGREKKMNVLREALRPGTVVSFPLTIDTGVCKVTKEELENAIVYFSGMYEDCFLKKFKGKFDFLENRVWLGGGSGFVTKTEVYPLFGSKEGVEVTVDIWKGIGVKGEHGHEEDRRKGVSPHVCKVGYYRGKQYLMGSCLVEIVERGEGGR